ncbi:MAG: PspC domain-containing protein [Bacteroidota bacterium]
MRRLPTKYRDQLPSKRTSSSLTRARGSLTGVCAGIAKYFNVPSTWTRLAFLLSIPLTSGFSVLAYLGLAFGLPKEDGEGSPETLHPQGSMPIPPPNEVRVLCSQCYTVARPFARYCHRCGADLPE